MAAWLIRVIGKHKTEIDKDLLVQAILALGRQIWEQQQAAQRPKSEKAYSDGGVGKGS